MSQLLGRVAKLSSAVKKQRLCFSELRSFSTAAATPYLLLRDTNHRRAMTPSGGGVVLDMNLYDPRKDERVKVPDQTLSEELRCSVKVGTSRGWVFLRNKEDSTMRLTNIYNPCASASSHKVINLPPFDDTEAHIASISLSASPNQQDCVVAAKSCFPFISLCRPGDSDWTHIKVPFYASQVMYSLRDSKFYLYWGGKQYSDLIECETSSSGFPEVSLYQSFPNSDIPESRRDQVSSSMKTQYLVESPNSGDSFIVYWCNEYLELKEGEPESCNGKKPPYRRTSSFMIKPRTFVVFRQDREQGIGSYTEDIGDLCIFLGQREAFCVSATEYPGLHPNSVYYSSFRTGYGYYDLSSNTLHDVIDEAPLSSVSMWLAPLQ
ncbi:PREDICTED: uncharacterized protein LOC104708790 [Camelina sativa]|uniref:Uncharacterized protein LOC104708790 n=1 Tax=Camelina sativa TaxID=90675 RepID=A0ABM0TBH3_CAMSA|nr:PREDICTED: uncharacterized protein LOC104708790 [Camelina sativa]